MSSKTPPLGSLKDRVQLQTKVTTTEPDAGAETNFIPLATVWARVHVRARPLKAEGDARTATATHNVVMRFRTDLSPGDRILYRGDVLEVEAAHDLNGRRAYLSCACAQTKIAG